MVQVTRAIVALACALLLSLAISGPAAARNHHRQAHSHHFQVKKHGAVGKGWHLRRGKHRASAWNGRPSSCPARRWCGCWLANHLGLPRHGRWNLDLARNWRHIGTALRSPQERAIVVWGGHVGMIVGRTPTGWIVLSGNDSNRVRARVRSLRGAIAFRSLNAGLFSFAQTASRFTNAK